MEGRRDRNISVLIGVGLVLVGLTAGILVMLFVVDLRPAQVEVRQPVERVELGRRDIPRTELALDSIGLPVAIEPLTLNRLFKQVADQVTPAVVFIQVEVPATRDAPSEWYHNFDGETRRRFFRDQPPRQSVGSGVIVSRDGYIVTNHHVVENAQNVQVTLSDKRLFDAHIVGVDPSTDLAVIKIEDPRDLPVAAFGNSDRVEVGEWVLAVGNPFRLTSTVTAGIVSALGRQVNIINDNFRIEDFIQTDAAINPGNSGGAVVNLQGELVGIATAIATETGSYAGYGFAVPVNLVERVARDLIDHGSVQRGFLGVTIEEIDAPKARQLGLERIGGVYVHDVRRGGAADLGGVRDGDVVLSIDGRAVNAPNELQSAVARRRPGDRLAVQVLRSGSLQELAVELLGRENPAYETWFAELGRTDAPPPMPRRERELPEADIFEVEDWGIGFRDLSDVERDAFGTDDGAYVAYIGNGGPASLSGLPRDVVILQIGDQEIQSAEDALHALSDAGDVEEAIVLRVRRRDGISAFYEIEVPVPAG